MPEQFTYSTSELDCLVCGFAKDSGVIITNRQPIVGELKPGVCSNCLTAAVKAYVKIPNQNAKT